MEKSLIHSNELHFISKKRIHQAVEKMVESLDLAAGFHNRLQHLCSSGELFHGFGKTKRNQSAAQPGARCLRRNRGRIKL